MRRPHVFERSAPRIGREGYTETGNRATSARLLAAQLGTMIERAEQAGLQSLSEKLEAARVEAEKLSLG